MKRTLLLASQLKFLWSLGGAVLLGTTAWAAPFPSTADKLPTLAGDISIAPVNHASFALGWKDLVILVDPVGDPNKYKSFTTPDLILITHAHPDHISVKTLMEVAKEKTVIFAPLSVAQMFEPDLKTKTSVLTNGEVKTILGFKVESVPMYNTTPERKQYHPQGQGNGYVITFADKRIYISGDTEDIPEMRALKNIDAAFVSMNLPYTMSVDQAASAVLAFKPKIVYPYHSKGSDLDKFKSLLGNNSGVEVRQRDWYKP
jgi:L-ascorbate metabolism protein UlaG (beta-lactamase superfamily)